MTTFPSLTFPDLGPKSLGWSIHRRPTYSTRVAAAVSGREVTAPYYATPLWEFELTVDQMNSGWQVDSIPPFSLQALQGFFLQLQGQYGSFLFQDPDFSIIQRGPLGTGNASAEVFPLVRTIGIYTELVQYAVVSAVYLNGAALSSSGWTVVNGNQLTLAAAPGAGVTVSADYVYYFVCRFLDDVHDYEEFLHRLHTLKSCKFRSRRTS